jgi:phospholipid transport system substrate-binding protein
MHPRRFILGSVLLLAVAFPIRARSADDAAQFIEDRAHAVIQVIDDQKLTPEERENKLHAIAVEAFDVPRIAHWVLGRYWATATPAQRQGYTQAFERYMVHVYASRFDLYQDAKVAITGARPQGDQTLVRAEISWRGGTQPAKVDWWVRKSGNGDKILDVSVDGVSELLLWRDEFADILARNGGQVAALIQNLKEKAGG